ncbi:cwf21-domain-containing protein, partial [Fistulina hepatica ATCC 64428]
MYNGIGLTTPRGSGTNGYVIRNLSAMRPHQSESAADRAAAWDVAPPKHREPDQAILEHERLRQVEVKCLELQLQLEDDGVDEDEIADRVDALRTKLVTDSNNAAAKSAKLLKPSDTHALAAAKKDEMAKMAAALGVRKDYQEGDAWNKDKIEEERRARATERAEREERREKDRLRMQEQKERWMKEQKERDRLRRRREDAMRK